MVFEPLSRRLLTPGLPYSASSGARAARFTPKFKNLVALPRQTLPQCSVLVRLLALIILFLAVPAEAHLVLDRRPLDVLVARSESMLVAEVTRGTQAAGALRATSFRAVTCLAGPCPKATFRAAGLDDHAAEFSTGKRYLVGLTAQPATLPGGETVRYRVVQNAWEAREFEPGRLAELRRFVPLFAGLLKLPPPSAKPLI